MPLPCGYVLSGSTVHIWWLCMESQVVLKSVTQWSVDISGFDICHPLLLKGRAKSVFPYVYAFFFACRFVQMVLWTLFTLGCFPRCFENWWVNMVCMWQLKKYYSFKNKIQFILGSIFPSGLYIFVYLFIYSYIVYIVYFPQQFCFHINKLKNIKATLI